jgi:nucleoside-diphosphate-sugar epimerase
MTVVIVGAGGWLSRAAEFVLTRKLEIPSSQIRYYGSYSRNVSINGNHYSVAKWTINVENEKANLFLPFAFQTVDKYAALGKSKYVKINRDLTAMSVDYIRKNKPSQCLLISSGIVSQDSEILDRDEGYHTYANLKLEEELALKQACLKSGSKLLICRLFSCSGRHMTEPLKYAFGNFISQAIEQKEIRVSSEFPVYRKYVDAAQLLEICLKSSPDYDSMMFESSGELIELHDLASKVGAIFRVPVSNKISISHKSDYYYSGSNIMNELASKYGIRLLDIGEQINETILGIKENYWNGLD